MPDPLTLGCFTEDIADAVPGVDGQTTGQYGDGLGSENEERQLKSLLKHLRGSTARYPDAGAECDLVLPDGLPRRGESKEDL